MAVIGVSGHDLNWSYQSNQEMHVSENKPKKVFRNSPEKKRNIPNIPCVSFRLRRNAVSLLLWGER